MCLHCPWPSHPPWAPHDLAISIIHHVVQAPDKEGPTRRSHTCAGKTGQAISNFTFTPAITPYEKVCVCVCVCVCHVLHSIAIRPTAPPRVQAMCSS
jgi:hypothetical protein